MPDSSYVAEQRRPMTFAAYAVVHNPELAPLALRLRRKHVRVIKSVGRGSRFRGPVYRLARPMFCDEPAIKVGGRLVIAVGGRVVE